MTSSRILQTSLRHAREALIKQLDLTGANLASSIIIIIEVQFNEDYQECKNANFDNATIMDEEILSTHFHNSNGNNVPPAVKGKKRA
jgi:hypothetical protein